MTKVKVFHSALQDTATLGEVKAELREHWKTDGIVCAACTQLVNLYPRPIHSTMVYLLVRLFLLDRARPDFYHVKDIYDHRAGNGSNDFAKFKMWEMIEQKPKVKGQKGRTSGFWRITEKGKAFVRGEITIPLHALVFNKKCYGFSGQTVSIQEALGIKFDYDQLMKG